jgi:hypothetical protein
MSSTTLYNTDKKDSRTVGVVVTLLVHVCVCFVFFRVALTSTVVVPLLSVEVVLEPEQEEIKETEILKIRPVAASGKKVDEVSPTPTQASEIDDQSGDVDVPAEKPPIEIDNRSLFRSRDIGEVADNASGEQVDSRALYTGDHGAQASSEEIPSFTLEGRSIIGKLVQPVNASNHEGKVVVEITVNQQGKVIKSQARAKGSTIQDVALWKAAQVAAAQTLFNVDLKSPVLQVGTITYNFKLR